jgi:UDP-glucose 4-epimerase
MKKIIITGATSMLGIALINECISNNAEVMAIVRENSSKINRIPKSPLITLVECNLENLKNLKADVSKPYDTFYHFAWAETSNLSRNNVDAHSLNIKYTLDVVELANKLGCKTFIGAGSQAEYGRKESVIKSYTECNPETAYGIAKFAAGKLSAIKCESLGIKHIWARVFSVFGPNNKSETMIMYCIRKLFAGEKPCLTKCEQMWDYLFCDDAARALFLLGQKGSDKKIYNIASGKKEPLINYVKQIRDLIDSELELEIGSVEYTKNQVMHLCADISDLTKDTGFVPEISFKEGAEKSIQWVRDTINTEAEQIETN